MNVLSKALAGVALFASAALAQQLTPQQLKAACESAPGNTLTFTAPLKVSGFSARVNVATGCRIVFAANGFIETDSINMGFAGPLVFQGGLKSGVKLVKTLLEAPSVGMDLAGGENLIEFAESTVRATTGNVLINAGEASQWHVNSRFAGRAHAIIAAGSIQVNGAGKFDASLSASSLTGTTGISIGASGNELTLAVADTNLLATSGAIAITSPGRQATLTYTNGQMRAGSGIAVTFSGNEGQLALQQVTANAGTGSASFVTALSGARPAKSIVYESNITASSVTVSASAGGESGEAALETSRVTSTGDVIVRSGPLGTTNVKLNTLRSNSLVNASTGPSGSCTAEGNTVFASVQQLCL